MSIILELPHQSPAVRPSSSPALRSPSYSFVHFFVGLHRYVIFLACQTDKIDPVQDGSVKLIPSSSADGRYGFNTPEFLKKYKMTPKGASFFHAQWDESVPAVYASMNIPEIDLLKKPEEAKIESGNRYTRM